MKTFKFKNKKISAVVYGGNLAVIYNGQPRDCEGLGDVCRHPYGVVIGTGNGIEWGYFLPRGAWVSTRARIIPGGVYTKYANFWLTKKDDYNNSEEHSLEESIEALEEAMASEEE